MFNLVNEATYVEKIIESFEPTTAYYSIWSTHVSGMMAEVTTVLEAAGITICSCVVSGWKWVKRIH